MFHRAGFADTEPMRLQRGGIGCHTIGEIISKGCDDLGGNAQPWRRQGIRTFSEQDRSALDGITARTIHD
jgi:hypothetical protein